jgi:hypothetical protein
VVVLSARRRCCRGAEHDNYQEQRANVVPHD